MLYLGIDQHARQITISLRDDSGDVVQARQVSTRPEKVHAFFQQLTHERLTYVRQNQEEYEAQMKEKQLKALKRKARQLGLELIEKPSAGSGTAETPIQR